jgi:hypothetical protein
MWTAVIVFEAFNNTMQKLQRNSENNCSEDILECKFMYFRKGMEITVKIVL